MISFIKSQWAIILLTLLTFLSAFYLDFMKEKLGGMNVLIGATTAFLIVLISMVIFALMARIQVKEDYEERYKILEAFIKGQGLGDIISERHLSEIERKAKDIWVFTHDMTNDIGVQEAKEQENVIFETVKKNLADGKVYTYFLPNTQKIHGSIVDFSDKHDYEKEQVSFCLIPPDEFHFVSEIAVYDAENEAPTQAVQWFPSNKMNYYIRMDEAHRNHIVGIGKMLLQKFGRKYNV